MFDFSNLFAKRRTESAVFVDVGAGSVAGGYASYPEQGEPILTYAKRIPIELRLHEAHEDGMIRALGQLGSLLITEGAPAHARVTGSGHLDSILVSVSAPWQKTSMHLERFENEKPFVFTKKMLAQATRTAGDAPKDMLVVDESVIAVSLNGYETHEPVGKRAHRATVVVLTSLIDDRVARRIAGALKQLFHTERILSIAGSSLRYQALKQVFPHERDVLIIDASGPEISIALERKGLLSAVSELKDGESGSPKWVQEVASVFEDLSRRFPLPRTIFLLSEKEKTEKLKKLLEGADLGRFWLSEDPPKVVPVVSGNVTGLRSGSEAVPDLPLLLMTLFWQRHRSDS